LQLRPQTGSYVAATLWMYFDEERAGASLRSVLWRITAAATRWSPPTPGRCG
jgi:DNA-binding SARP family transcriptional activator